MMRESTIYATILESMEKPKGMPAAKFTEYKKTILEQMQVLQKDGWDQAALILYLDRQKSSYTKKYRKETTNDHQAIFLVGSEIYTDMFEKSQLTDQEKVMLVIHQLGGYLDDQGDLQFRIAARYKFSPQMPPGAPFLDTYSKAVQCTYPNGLVIAAVDKKLSKRIIKKKYPDETKIHQFRNQLDKQAINYVEKYKARYGLKNDEEAIKLILKDNWFYADPQYHNRGHLGVDILGRDLKKSAGTLTNKELIKIIRKRGFYRKILSGDYHSEFIVDEQGQLLSQWTEQAHINEYWESAIANGESFNYGKRPSIDHYQTHDKLDGNPPKYFDTNKRNELKRMWLAPTDTLFYQLVRRLAEKGLRYKRKKPNEAD